MESFLSLPRSAKAGLAVLLAVALLGWGIVAYSSKRQHEDARSLQQAVATLDSKAEVELALTGELEEISAQLAAAEASLSNTMEDKTGLEAKVGQLETDISERETAIADLEERLASLQADVGALAEGDQALGLVGNQPANVDIATLRERLTKASTALSARSATLQQRDRELERVRTDYEAATTRIQELEADLVEEGVLRERLSKTMTTLSGRTATLAQRDRELEKVQADYEAATARIEGLEAGLVEQDALRERLTETMTKLSGQSAMLSQRDRSLAALQEEHESLLAKLAVLEAGAAEQAVADQALASLEQRVGRTEQAMKEGASALAVNQQKIAESEARLAELKTELESVEKAVQDKKQTFSESEKELVRLSEQILAGERKLTELQSALEQHESDIEQAKKQLADLEMAQAEIEAGISSLTAEIEQQESSLANKEDAIAYADTRLVSLEEEVTAAEKRISETEAMLEERVGELEARQEERDEVEASLTALKEERTATATEAVAIRKTITNQEAVLKDLEAAKSDLQKTKTELSYQEKLLSERQQQIATADNRLDQLQQAVQGGASENQTFARIPIAAVSTNNLAILPVDPLYEPFPVQTPLGIRLTQVHFDMGSAELTPGGVRKAKEAAAWIKAQDVEKIRLVGFTDTIGTKANNLSLAKRRAASLRRVFEEQGVDPDRIELIAKGEVGAREITEDHTAEPLNRCVGVFIGADG